ncbi:MAG: acylphosphatase [Candidatus Portnoybacteria bacterium]
MIKRVILKIYGRVQMVMYRDSTQRKASKLGLVGWVRNEDDGSVKVVAEGKEKDLEKLIDWCYNGPMLAKVDKIGIDWQKATPKKTGQAGQFNKFEIKY